MFIDFMRKMMKDAASAGQVGMAPLQVQITCYRLKL